MITSHDVFVYEALKTPQFWLIWGMLSLNVTAGIGVAGVPGPVLVNDIRQYNIDQGMAKHDACNVTMYLGSGLLVVDFCCDLAVRAVDKRHHMPDAAA